ncbi:MAG: ribonuclease III [Alphaproteobacteria bacterium]
MSNLIELIEYEFKNKELLEAALTHPSIFNNKQNTLIHNVNYEKLEFLGDAVLGLIMTEFLIKEYVSETEGSLAKRRAALVSGATLAQVANKINLGPNIKMTQGEDLSGGRENQHNLENCLEALIGALYLDGGFEIAKKFIHTNWISFANEMHEPPKDPKTALQEWAQKHSKAIPEYIITKSEGPAHLPKFTVKVIVEDMEEVFAEGKSKKIAERKAAQILLKKIEGN